MGHKIKYGAKFFLKIKFFPYLPTHFFGVMLPETNILFILAQVRYRVASSKVLGRRLRVCAPTSWSLQPQQRYNTALLCSWWSRKSGNAREVKPIMRSAHSWRVSSLACLALASSTCTASGCGGSGGFGAHCRVDCAGAFAGGPLSWMPLPITLLPWGDVWHQGAAAGLGEAELLWLKGGSGCVLVSAALPECESVPRGVGAACT